MSIKEIPFIICNYNQLTYLRNLINQIRFYYPHNPIEVIDNGSDYQPLIDYYHSISIAKENASVVMHQENDFVKNLNHNLQYERHDYYVITDPDLSIHPATPPNFLEIFKTAIDTYGFHHAGFGLITDDIPEWNPKAGWIQGDEKALLTSPVGITYDGKQYIGHKAPIDTTFCLYKRDNGGWKAPQDGEAWSNSLRLFKAFHLPWYLHKDHLNDEMKNYFATCKKREAGKPTAGQNHYNPFNGME